SVYHLCIAQSKALSPDADEPASLSRDDRHREAFPTVSSLDAGQDRVNIAKTYAISYDSSPRVPYLDVDESSMQQRLHELMELCTSLQRQQSQMADQIKDQDIKIYGLKARVKSLKDKERRHAEPIQEDAPITGRIIDIEEELGAAKSTKKGSNDTEEMCGNTIYKKVKRSNEVIAKHLSEYEQAEADLSVGEKIELIIWKQWEDFVPMSSKEESEKVKRPRIKLDQGSSKGVKISHTSRSKPSQEQQFKGSKGVSEEELKGIMQLVLLEEVYIEALLVKHPIIDWEIHSEGKREY
nr:hypothetical protein [Tanacetum cinerariifolium]